MNNTLPCTREFLEYYKVLFKSNEEKNILPFQSHNLEIDESDVDPMMKPIDKKEIDDALVHCKSKAACADGYSPKFIKDVSFAISKLLPSAYNAMLKYGRFPKYMLKCHLIFLFKEGRVDLPENYRSIAINNPWSKILWKIIHTRLVKYAEERNLLPALQFGFRSKRSTLSAIFTLKKIILDNFKLKKKTHVYFIDLKKAFPSVSSKLLFK